MAKGVRIALIHATPVAIEPITEAFRAEWPGAELANLLDDSLSGDRAAAGALTPPFFRRIEMLAGYALKLGARGILFTCSAFGEAIEAVAKEQSVPVLKPNEAMFEAALAEGARRGLLATFEPSVASMTREFEDMARDRGKDAVLEVVCVEGAMAALKAGDGEAHDRLLAEAAPRLADCDAVMLAHFSTARAETAVASRLSCPVLSAPGSAVRKLRRALQPV